MSPLGVVLDAWLHPLIVGASLVVGWWCLWFTLGQEFLRTLSMLLAARAVSIGGAVLLLASGALGHGVPLDGTGQVAWLVAATVLWLAAWSLEAAVLGSIMKRRRTTWRWDGYDLAVLGAAHLAYLLGAALLA